MEVLTIADHIVFGLLAFVLPLFAVFRVRPRTVEIPSESSLKIKLYWLNCAVLWLGALIVLALWLIPGRSLSTLGFQPPEMQYFPEWMIITAFFVLFYMFEAMVSWSDPKSHPAANLLPGNVREFIHFGSVVAISAGVCEEMIFRGFVVFYLMALLEGGKYTTEFAIVASAVLFGVVHAYQGLRSLLKIIVLAILFAWIFVLSKSLYLLIFLHFAVDFAGGLMALLRQKQEAPGQSPFDAS